MPQTIDSMGLFAPECSRNMNRWADPIQDPASIILRPHNSPVLTRLIETCLRDFNFEFEKRRLPLNPQQIGGFEQSELVIICVYQPFTIGLSIVQRLKQRTHPPTIVALTTDRRETSMALIDEAGAHAIVKMPFRPDELRDAVTATLESQPMN